MERWREEFLLIRYEMGWTVRYFAYKKQLWDEVRAIAGPDPLPGPVSYANRQAAMWYELAMFADQSFRKSNVDYKSPL